MKLLLRLGAISKVLIKHGFSELVERLFKRKPEKPKKTIGRSEYLLSSYPSPKRLRLILQELGPSFIKLGQLMSTRADLLPPEYITELIKLQDKVAPLPFEQVKNVLEHELKRPISEIFKEIKPEPVGAASVAQVHDATLFSGERVAVKVVRPGIDKKIREDIRLMYYVADKIEKNLDLGRIMGARSIVKEFEHTIFRELDMFVEAGSMERFANNFRDVREIHIPKAYWDYTTRSVLVMEHIDGIKMDHVEEIKAHGIDPEEIALIGLRSFSRQLMEFGFFHADPHPGNTIVMYDGRVGLVDFGITGYLDEEVMLQIANIFLGYAEHDYNMVIDALLDAGLVHRETMDMDSFKVDLKDVSEPFYGRSLSTISVKDVYEQVIRLVLKYRIRLPRNLLLLLKTFVQTEALGKILSSKASILEVTRPYAKQLLERSYEARKLFKNIGRDARITGNYLRNVPEFIHDILRQTAQGKQKLELKHSGFQPLGSNFEKGLNRLTVGIIISASIIGAAQILDSSQKVLEFSIDFFGLQTISLTNILGLIGYSIATVLGVWLIISIIRSGKL
jgi:ubiquinone biosynthesis protein